MNAQTSYEVKFEAGADLPDGRATGRMTLVKKRAIPPYLEPVPLASSAVSIERWKPFEDALFASPLYRDEHADELRSQSALNRILQRGPGKHVEGEHDWLDQLEWAVGRAPREKIAELSGRAEEAFVKRFGAADPLVYVRSFTDMAAFQVAEVLAKFEVMKPSELFKASLTDTRPELVLENGPNHGHANYFLIPMSATFPRWMGVSMANVSYWVLFVLRQPREVPLLDVWHRDQWNAWLGSWYRPGIWEPAEFPRPSDFVRWYVEHLNDAIRLLLDFGSTSGITGQIRPMAQLAMTRFFFHLHDLIGRLAMTSDPYTRFLLAFSALDRFDALGWSYDVIGSPVAMEAAMKPLAHDQRFGPILGPLAARTWARAMRGLAEESAGMLSDDMQMIELPSGKSMKTSAYLSDFLRRLRNTIHTFDEEHLRSVLGSHSGRIPTSFAQFWVLVWLRLLADPSPLSTKFKRP